MRRALVLIAVLGLLFGSPGAAVAVTQQTNGWTWIGPHNREPNFIPHFYGTPECIWQAVWISNDYGNPWLQSVATMDMTVQTSGGIHECADHSYVADAYQIAVRQDAMYFNNNLGRWTLCNAGPWVQNTAPSHEVWTAFAWATRPCYWGHWYYGVTQGAAFWNHWHYGITLLTDAVYVN